MVEKVEIGDPQARHFQCPDCPNDVSCPVKNFLDAFNNWTKEGKQPEEMAEDAGLQFNGSFPPEKAHKDSGPFLLYVCPKGQSENRGQVKIYLSPLTLHEESKIPQVKRSKKQK